MLSSSKEEQHLKKGLFIFMFTFLLLPVLQYHFHVIDSGELHGYYTNAKDVAWSPAKWIDGSYQAGKSDFINDHVGFRQDLLRLNDQVEFSMFSKPVCGGTVICKENCLMYDNYIETRYGRDFVGYESAAIILLKLRAIQDTLARAGKTFILVFSPSKADYFSELIPDDRRCCDSVHTNYRTFVHLSDSLGIQHIDLNAWFMSMKNKTKDLLFTKQGIHWTFYGSFIGGDSIIRYIEHARNIRMHHPLWTRIQHTTDARLPDNDMAADLNLIFPISNDVFSYPEVHYSKDTAEHKPNAIFIGDSFIMNLAKSQLLDNVFDNWQYWFYMRMMCDRNNYEGYGSNPKFERYNWKAELKKTDCVIIMYTSIGLKELGNGFIDQAYDFYFPKSVTPAR